MSKINVVSKRNGAPGEYIGRPSPLGNPFKIGPDGTREEVIAKYRIWFADKMGHEDEAVRGELIRLWKILKRDGRLNLKCWCAPLQCHGDVIKDFLDTHLD